MLSNELVDVEGIEHIELIESTTLAITPGSRWSPTIGEELLSFLERVPTDAVDKTRDDAIEILARGTRPTEQARRAGLVVGHVQSGKTTSFTAVAAAARDNGYPLVIVIAGTSKPLLEQTTERLIGDLRLDSKDAHRRWVHVQSPQLGSDDAEKMESALSDWLDPSMDHDIDDVASVLVTVMKQHTHLDHLGNVLEDISSRIDLGRLSAIVIDDEVDQASPNLSKRAGSESATYGRIRRVRTALPSHTLLEYTATPQAPLLVSIADELSPDYVCVIDPGKDYTGGKYFFEDHRASFVQSIPSTDLAAIDGDVDEPPRSLLHAFACFAIGAAAGELSEHRPSQRAMLVHPSQKTLPHARFVAWIKSIRDLWVELLELHEGDDDRQEVIDRWLRPQYEDLAESVADIPPLDQVIARLPRVLKKCQVQVINATAGKAEPPKWSTAYAWVLVGGQLLDRGFTVEGLTVTYMPRGLGVGNADTVQQRARFFGYKRSYAGYCRAWLDPTVDDAFTAYVRHEEAMRNELITIAEAGSALKDWTRVFLLDKRLRLTRAAVIRLAMHRNTFGEKWFTQTAFDPSVDREIIAKNRSLVENLQSVLSQHLVEDPGSDLRSPSQRHPMADSVALSDLLERFLVGYVMTDEDAGDFTALRVLLEAAEERNAETCRVHFMSSKGSEPRYRSLNEQNRIKALFQGANAATEYNGDRSIRDDNRVTLQLHRVSLRSDDGTNEGTAGRELLSDVPVLAIWVPERLDESVLLQRDA